MSTATTGNGHRQAVLPATNDAKVVTIKAPNFQVAEFKLVGTAPLVVNKFSQKAREQIMKTQSEGKQSRGKKVREPKDFDAVYKGAFHVSSEGWYGFPAGGFKAALVRACSVTDMKMTVSKMALFIEADGIDADEGTPLVKINGTPKKHEGYARNDDGSVDIRVRPLWAKWTINLRVRYDGDMLSLESVANLVSRAGLQVGIGEGRPFSKNSTGMGWGTFAIEGKQ